MEFLSFRVLLLSLKKSLNNAYLNLSDEEFVSLIIDPLVFKYNIKNKNGELVHFDRFTVSKLLSGNMKYQTQYNLKKVSENNSKEFVDTLMNEFENGKFKDVFDTQKLEQERRYLCGVIKNDEYLYPSQIKKLISIYNLYEFFSKMIQFTITINRKEKHLLDDKITLNDCFSKVINYIISNKKINNNLVKHNISYTISDKCEKNYIDGKFKERIIITFDKYYYNLDSFFEDYINFDYAIYDRISNYYSDIYLKVLIDNDINFNDLNAILDNSIFIFSSINEQIQNTLFNNKVLRTSYEDSKEYIMALTTYVFYKCKFLIPMEVNNDN